MESSDSVLGTGRTETAVNPWNFKGSNTELVSLPPTRGTIAVADMLTVTEESLWLSYADSVGRGAAVGSAGHLLDINH